VEALIQALKDTTWSVRENAAEALGEIGDARAVEALIQALKDQSGSVRANAAWALGKIGRPAVEPLIQALEDEDGDVRAGAAEALERIGGKRAVEALAQVRKSPTYLVSISTVDSVLSQLLPINWPQRCCICLEPVGPFDFYEIREKGVFRLEIPYCKNCRHKVKKLFGGESQGVSIGVHPAGITLRFRNPLYAKMFRQANKKLYKNI